MCTCQSHMSNSGVVPQEPPTWRDGRLVSKSQECIPLPLPGSRITNMDQPHPAVLLGFWGWNSSPQALLGLPDFPPHQTSHSEETRKHLLPRPDKWIKRKDGLATSATGKVPEPSHPHTMKLMLRQAPHTIPQPRGACWVLRFGGRGQNKHPGGGKETHTHCFCHSTVGL